MPCRPATARRRWGITDYTHRGCYSEDLSNRWGIFLKNCCRTSGGYLLTAGEKRRHELPLLCCFVRCSWSTALSCRRVEGSLFFVACLSFSLRVLASFWRADTISMLHRMLHKTQLFFRRSECPLPNNRRSKGSRGSWRACSLLPAPANPHNLPPTSESKLNRS